MLPVFNWAGRGRPVFSKIESGDDGVKMKSVDKVLKALGLSPHNLLLREEAAATAVV